MSTYLIRLLGERDILRDPLAVSQVESMQRAGIPCVGFASPVLAEGIEAELWLRPMTISERCEFCRLNLTDQHGWQLLALAACDPDTSKLLYTQADIPAMQWAYQLDLATLVAIERQILRINGWSEWITLPVKE